MKALAESARRLLFPGDGRLAAELDRVPGGFGLGQVPARRKPDATTTAVCGYCSIGCGLELHLQDGVAVNLSPAPAYPVNRGVACPKGWQALRPLDSSERATTPLLRHAGKLVPVDWDDAAATFAREFRRIQREHGPGSLAFLSTGQIPTEEMALLGAVAKFGMGIVHGDGNTRQCMATSAVAYKQAFGFDAPPYTYADLEESDAIFLVGANLAIAHPILWSRLRRNRRRPAIVVVDPRCTETALAATEHLQIAPKSDLALFYGLAHCLVRDGRVDRAFVEAHTTGFDEYARHVAAFPPERVSAATRLPVETIERTARLVAERPRVSFWWTMGVNQSYEGVRTAQAIIALALLTGNVGRPGTGANSITGQANAMGSRIFSNTTNLFGGRDFTSASDRADVARILGIDVARIPDVPSLAYDQIVEGVAAGTIRGLWIVATNPAHSWIGQSDFLELLGRLEFLVVQDMYATTETAAHAHLVLPAAGWGEKEGTFINSERRIGRMKRVRSAPGAALPDFEIFHRLAAAWGCADLFTHWRSPEAAFQILRELSRGRPCDISGIDGYAALDREGGIQWPWPDSADEPPARERRLFANGRFFHADGRARFHHEEPRRMPEPPDEAYPFVLLTGRGSVAQWHTQTRTAKSPVLRKLHPGESHVEIHPDDAAALGVGLDQEVAVESRRGRIDARALVTATVGRGRVFVAMHGASVNRLTDPSFDPYSRQPSYKACAVRVRPLEHWERAAS